MPYYYFEAVTTDGKIRKKVLKARDKKDADRRLRDSGLRPMLVESTRVVRKKKHEKVLRTRRVVRNTLTSVAALSLIGGVGAYLIVLDLSTVNRFDVQTLSRSGIVAYTPSIINAKTEEERDFAREVFGVWEKSFPDSIRGIEIKHKGLMLLYVKSGRNRFKNDHLRSLASTITYAFQRRFETSNCMLLIVHGDETLAECRFQNEKAEPLIY